MSETIRVEGVDVELLREQRNNLLDIIGQYESDINSKDSDKDSLDGVVNMLDSMLDIVDDKTPQTVTVVDIDGNIFIYSTPEKAVMYHLDDFDKVTRMNGEDDELEFVEANLAIICKALREDGGVFEDVGGTNCITIQEIN